MYFLNRYHKASQTNSHALTEMAKIINLESNEDLETSSATEPMLISGKKTKLPTNFYLSAASAVVPKCILNRRHDSLGN